MSRHAPPFFQGLSSAVCTGVACRKLTPHGRAGCAYFQTWAAADSVFAEMLAKEPAAWDREDAITAALQLAFWVPFWEVGGTACTGGGEREMAFVTSFMAPPNPYIFACAGSARYQHLALLCLDLLRAPEGLPEGVLAGAWISFTFFTVGKPENGKRLWEAGVLEVMQATLRRYSALERVGRGRLIPTALCPRRPGAVKRH
jgi:hypothetical protein